MQRRQFLAGALGAALAGRSMGLVPLGGSGSPAAFAYKFRPGFVLMTISTAGGQAANQAEMNLIASSPGVVGYAPWYKWNQFENSTQGTYSFTAFDTDFLYLQSVSPGYAIVPLINWYSNATIADANLSTYNPQGGGIPLYILNNPSTFGAGPGASPYGGWLADSYISPNYYYQRANMCDANVVSAWKAMLAAFLQHIVPDGSGLTVDKHPLVLSFGTATPTDTNLDGAPHAPSNYTYTAYNAGYQSATVGVQGQHTAFASCAGFGANSTGGANSPPAQNTLVQAIVSTNGMGLTCTDMTTVADYSYAQNYFVGNNYNGATGFQPSSVGKAYSMPTVQGDDYGNNSTPNLSTIFTAAEGLGMNNLLLCVTSSNAYTNSAAYSIPAFWNNYMIPYLTGTHPQCVATRPTNLT